MSTDKFANWIALVSVLASAATAMHSTWSNKSTQVQIEELKAKFDAQKSDNEKFWTAKKERCTLIYESARNLAEANGKVYKQFDLSSRATIDANLWAASTLLPPETQKKFLSAHQKGTIKDDEHQFERTTSLVSIVLEGLAVEGQRCLLVTSKQ